MQQFDLKSMTLRDVWQIFRRRMWIIILPLVSVVAVAVPVSFLLTPQYRTFSIITTGEINEGQVLEGLGAVPRQPRERLRRVSERIFLKYRDEIFEKTGLENYLQSEREKPLTPDAKRNYLEDIIQIRNMGGDMVKITATHPNPDMAMNIANVIANVYVEKSIQRQDRAISQSFRFIERQLEKYRGELEQAELDLLEARKKGVLLDNNNVQLVGNLSKLDADLFDVNWQLQEAQGKLQEARQSLQNGTSGSGKYIDEEVLRLKSELASLKAQLNEYLTKYSEQWPDVKRLKAEIRQKEKELNIAESKITAGRNKEELDEIIEYWRERVKTLTLKKNSIESEIEEKNRKLRQLPQRQLDLARLTRRRDATESVYTMLLQRLNQAQLLQDTSRLEDMASTAEVFYPADRPQFPVSPNQKKIVLMAVALGLMLGGGTAFVLEYFDHSIRTVDELEEYTKLDVLGTIPKVTTYKSELKAERNKRIKIALGVTGGLIVLLLIVDFINFSLISNNSQFLNLAQKTLELMKQVVNRV